MRYAQLSGTFLSMVSMMMTTISAHVSAAIKQFDCRIMTLEQFANLISNKVES
jgi:hypothetical protein